MKILHKSIKIGTKFILTALLGGPEAILAPRGTKTPFKKQQKTDKKTVPRPPKTHPKWGQHGSCWIQILDDFDDWLMVIIRINFAMMYVITS